MTLDEVPAGQEVTVVDLHLEGAEMQRLLDMGFVDGARARVVRNAPLKDPIDIKIKGYLVAVRHNEAKGIEVKPE